MYIASNDIKKIHDSSGLKNLRFQNTLMTSHECRATLSHHNDNIIRCFKHLLHLGTTTDKKLNVFARDKPSNAKAIFSHLFTD